MHPSAYDVPKNSSIVQGPPFSHSRKTYGSPSPSNPHSPLVLPSHAPPSQTAECREIRRPFATQRIGRNFYFEKKLGTGEKEEGVIS